MHVVLALLPSLHKLVLGPFTQKTCSDTTNTSSIAASVANSSGQTLIGCGMNLSIATCSTPSTTLATNTTNTCMLVPATNQIPLTSLLSNARAQGASVNIHASVTNTSGQVILGSGVNSACASTTTQETNPFILKKRTNLMKICQACRKGYDGNNDTLGLVVARLERRMISNMSTGIQFLGKASNSVT